MNKISKLCKKGSWVMTSKYNAWFKVEEVDEKRQWVRLEGFELAFKSSQIVQLSNKEKPPRVY